MDMFLDSSLELSALLVLLSEFEHSLESLTHAVDQFLEPIFTVDFDLKFLLVGCSDIKLNALFFTFRLNSLDVVFS
jgi:hypothetical protein